MANDPTQPLGEESAPTPPWRDGNTEDLSGVRLVDDYLIERLIGRGGCGCVYLAKDLPLDRNVAIKTLGAGQSPAFSTEGVQRFMREARAIASVEHANIVPVHRVGNDGDLSFIVMQYVKGQNLSERIHEEGRISVPDALLITQQIAAALEAAHGIGLVHRDIKPSNVMIDDQGHVKVMDFGLARTDDPDTAITTPGMFVGTPRYSSPEQCATTSIDCRSDLYSLGVILYEMLAGDVPHSGETPLALMHKIMYDPPPPIRAENPHVPEDVTRIIDRLLAKQPEERYATASELLRDLRAAIQRMKDSSSESFEPTIQLPTEHGTRSGAPSAGSPALMVAVGIVITCALVLGGLRLAKRSPRPVAPKPDPNPVIAKTQQQMVMAVYDFDNATKDPELDWLKLGIPDMLAANLSQQKVVDIRTRDEVMWAIKPPPSHYNDALRPQLADLGVQIVARGSIYREKDKLRFIVHVASLDGTDKLGIVIQKGTVDSVFTAVDLLATQIRELLMRRSKIIVAQAKASNALTTQQLFAQRLQPTVGATELVDEKSVAKLKETIPTPMKKVLQSRESDETSKPRPAPKSSPKPVSGGSPANMSSRQPPATAAPKPPPAPKSTSAPGSLSKIGSSRGGRKIFRYRAKSISTEVRLKIVTPLYYRGRQFLNDCGLSKAEHDEACRELIETLNHATSLTTANNIYKAWKAKRQAKK